MIQTVNAALYKSMIASGAALLEKNKQIVNELNVFPVPDGDTGTNMSLTLNSGVTAIATKNPNTVTAVADTAASALLRGARGNSGVILSLLFRGMSKALKDHAEMCVLDFAAALTEGVNAAYKAVMRPTEGTILTVSRLIAERANEYARDGEDFDELLETVLATGEEALAATTEQNPVLKKANVVDAGGQGYLYLLRGMLYALRGEPVEAGDESESTSAASAFSVFKDEDITYTYCTEFIVNRESDKDPEKLREFCSGIGDSLVFVEDTDIIKVHVHTDAPGTVLTQALTYGSFVSVKIENMRLQHTEMINKDEAPKPEPEAPKEAAPEKKYGVVAVCVGDGMKAVFENLGADAMVTGGQTMNPSTEDILGAVQTVPAEVVFVLPNNKNIIMAAQQCDPLTDKKVIVIPTKTVPQGISALINFDETMEEEELTEALTEACDTVHTAQITYAARDSEFESYHIHAGEYLALLESALVGSDSSIEFLLKILSERFKEYSPEVITVYYGEDVTPEDAEKVSGILGDNFPDADVTTICGGQPVYYYMISAE